MPIPIDEAVDERELVRSLERLLRREPFRVRRVVRLQRRLSDYCSTFSLEELDVEMEDGERYALVLKDLSWDGLIEAARGVKPEFLYNPLREIEMYRSVLESSRWATPRYFGSVADTKGQKYWLFLERVDGEKLRIVGEFDIWRDVAQWLARFHGAFRSEGGESYPLEACPLIRYDVGYYHRWMDRALLYLKKIESERTHESIQRIGLLAERYGEVVDHLVREPVTLLHGDFFPSNILIQRGEGNVRICPVDWEVAALGPGPVDLAALIAGSWTEDERADLAMAYYNALPQANRNASSPESFFHTLNLCRLHLAIQWLGWSTDWTPPTDERQDWLHEALQIAEELGLIPREGQ